MSCLIQAINQQIDHSIYASDQTAENKRRITTNCDRIKVAAAIIAFATPVFAFFFPAAFMTSISLVTALVAYDLFNMADNLGDAARSSAQGIKPDTSVPHVEMMLESTQLINRIYNRMKA